MFLQENAQFRPHFVLFNFISLKTRSLGCSAPQSSKSYQKPSKCAKIATKHLVWIYTNGSFKKSLLGRGGVIGHLEQQHLLGRENSSWN
jgi:hypothetical protein